MATVRTGEKRSMYLVANERGERREDGGWFSASEDCGEGDFVRAGGSSGDAEACRVSFWRPLAGTRDRSDAVDAVDAFRTVEAPRVTLFFGGGASISLSISSLVRLVPLVGPRVSSVGAALFAAVLVFLAFKPLVCAFVAIGLAVIVEVAIDDKLLPSSVLGSGRESASETIEKFDCVEAREALEVREAFEARPFLVRDGLVV